MKNTGLKDSNIGQLKHLSNPVVNEISKLDPQSACISKEVSHQLTQLAIDCGDDEGFVKIEEHKWLNGELQFGVRLVTNNKEVFRSN